ncbi:MAG: murein biosynthesis integral membrane protein MurJ [Syntrophomonadaceae bacterium]|nr:murein biosynthesis integral membrane protein MurJ [Syntrophomonadaceae bacterium]
MSDTGKRVAKAAVLLMITVIISRILGYGREVALYTIFGQNYITDAYRAAFSIPDFIYMLLVGGALSSAFIPIFSACLATDREEEGWKSASIVFNYVILLLVVLIALAYLYTRPLINLLAPGLPPDYISMAVDLTHIMFAQTFFMALNGFAMGILNSYNNFAAPALGSLVYNLVIIVVGVALVDQIGIAAFSYGVVLGAILNFVVQIPALRRVGMKYYFNFDYKDTGFHQIMILMVPVLAGLGVVQLNLFVTQNLSSGLGSGTISALNLAQRIMNLPIGIFAVSIATAVFPTLTALTARGELDMFKRTGSLGLRAIFLVSIPASLGLIAIGEPLISLLFQQGEFTASMVTATNEALIYYCIGLFAYSAIQVLNRGFYALKDTLTPVIAAALTIAFNIILSIQLSGSMGHKGLALAYSLAGFVNVIVLMIVLRKKVGKVGGIKIVTSFVIATGASLVMYGVVKFSTNFLLSRLILASKLNLLISVGTGICLGVLVYGVIIYLFKLEESELLLRMVRKRLPKKP